MQVVYSVADFACARQCREKWGKGTMKNPMDRGLESRLSQRAVEIGREGEVAGFDELVEMLNSSSANVRRLSASALGKLAWMGVDQAVAVGALAPVVRSDPHAQTRQYAIKALKAYGAAAQDCLQDLRDMAGNGSEKPYIQRDAACAVEFIEEAIQVANSAREYRCQRCSCRVSADGVCAVKPGFSARVVRPLF
jgi:hypothetical protein